MAAVMTVKPGSMRLTSHGKRLVAQAMYAKGSGFLGAAALLRRQGSFDAVVLHLMCQGVEIVLKALLLFRNYDKYHPELTRIGHNLEKLAKVTADEYGSRPLLPSVAHELAALNRRYSKHVLRYGSAYDILVDPATIPTRRVFRRVLAVMRLANKELCEKGDAT